MAYDEGTRKSRVVVQTPESRREVVQTERQYAPESGGLSSAMVAALVVVSVAVIGLLLLFFMTRTSNDNTNQAAQQQQPSTTVVQQPAQQPPVIVQQPAPASQPGAPIIVNQAPAGAAASGPDDASIQAAIDKRIQNDATLSTLGITATVANGKVTLSGMLKTEQLKHQVERLVRTIKGVKDVDNQIVVSGG